MHSDTEVIKKVVEAKNQAYKERNQLVAFISRLYPSHLAIHDVDDKTWERDWLHIVCVHVPHKRLTSRAKALPQLCLNETETVFEQMSWHIHDSDLPLFTHLHMQDNDWDGHTTEQKYLRLSLLPESNLKRFI